jgi:hypothetical protein
MRFRIVRIIHNVGELKNENGRFTQEYVIEKKRYGLWSEVMQKEIEPKRISHKTYEDAETYMVANYMGHGICKIIGNEYEYTTYTYYV